MYIPNTDALRCIHGEIVYSNENVESTTTRNHMNKCQTMLNERSQTMESANITDNHYEPILGVLQPDLQT